MKKGNIISYVIQISQAMITSIKLKYISLMNHYHYNVQSFVSHLQWNERLCQPLYANSPFDLPVYSVNLYR